MRQQNFKGPKLPKELRDQFGDPANRNNSGRARGAPLNRKERRKAERVEKKAQKKQPGSRNTRLQHAPQPESEEEEDDFEEFSPPPGVAPVKQSEPQKPLKSILKTTAQPPSGERQKDNASSLSPPPKPSRATRDRLAQDDAEIAALEKKLGMRKKKTTKEEDDVLDNLFSGLDGLDGLESDEDSSAHSAKRKRSGDTEDDAWLANKRQKALGFEEEHSELSDSELGSEDGFEEGDSDTDMVMDGEEGKGSDEGFESEDDSALDDFGSESDTKPQKPRVRENPYVPPVTSTSAPVAKYIPPARRAPPSSDAEVLSRLRRQLQGLLNRLSEANLLTILRDVEKVFQDNARGYVISTLIDLLIGLLADQTTLMDTFLILHAGFIAAVYKVIGTDFGAQLVERIVSEFDRHYNEGQPEAGKQPTNLMSLVAELYTFQVIGGNLIFDYIRWFLNELSDINAELLLRIVKVSGSQLRQDDPSALKDIVVLLQKSVARVGENSLSVRTKLMIETINNLKNNRMKTGVNASAIVSEHTLRMKKTLGTLNTRNLKGTEALRIGLADLRDTEKKGKWWLVGASWRNDAQGQTSATSTQEAERNRSAKEDIIEYDEGTTDLVQLAKEQRMNTDIRRAIFITIMSATDYKDAHIRLLKLSLKKSQELEIPRVLTHCAGSERVYNPYYTLIARRLCSEHKLKKAFQFSLWDIFKNLGEKNDEDMLSEDEDDDSDEGMSMTKVVNLGKMYGTLIANGGLPITSLKTLNFPYMQPKTKAFVEVILVTAIVQTQKASKESRDEKSLVDVFLKLDTAPQMARGLQYFIKKVVAKGDIAGSKAEGGIVRWACGVLVEALTDLATAKVLGEE